MSISKNRFRIIALASMVAGILAVYFKAFPLTALPEQLGNYLQIVDNDYEFTPFNIIISLFAVLALIGNIGLLFFAKWAPNLFTLGAIVCLLGPLSFGPLVEGGLEGTFYEIETLLNGFIIGLLYFSNVKKYFTNENT